MFQWILVSIALIPCAIVLLVLILGVSLDSLFSFIGTDVTTLECFHCGAETPASRKTCDHCGRELQ